MPNTCAIIQARMGSTRLPGKVMKRLIDHSVLGHVIRRVSASSEMDKVIVATSTLSNDDVIEEEAIKYGALVYRGSETDVLSRYAEAASHFQVDTVIRVTSDCPLIDADIIDEVIRLYRISGADYSSNVVERMFPRGMDTEVFSSKLLQQANFKVQDSFEREHVTVHFYRNPQQFQLTHLKYNQDFSECRWTLDTPEDWGFITAVYEHLYVPGKIFSWLEVLSLLERYPQLSQINRHIEQKPI